MSDLDQKFILADLKKALCAEKKESVSGVPQDWVEQVNKRLQHAEQGCTSREALTAVNPHVNISKGSALKRFIKRVIRKMIMWFFQPVVIQQSGYNCLNNDITNEMRDTICLMKDEMVRQQSQIAQAAKRLSELEKQVAALNQPDEQISDYIDYARFEEKFRGSQEEIRDRIRRYLSYFHAGNRVLDLGCGRGEWLELLKSIGADPIGVDLNENTIALCRKKGLTVEQDDLFHYLEQQPDDSLDGVTAIQVIEHLTPVQLAQLTQLCYRKLKFGGHVIFETQNPAVVSTLTNNFLIDPTHIRPVHPIWAKYLLDNTGFSDVTLDYPQYAWVTAGSIPPLEIPDGDAKAFNAQIAYLNNFLYGSTDYAIIGVKR